jgi:hypothetical protein
MVVSKLKKLLMLAVAMLLSAYCLYVVAVQSASQEYVYLLNKTCASDPHCAAFGDGGPVPFITVDPEEALLVGDIGRWQNLVISVTSVEPVTITNSATPLSQSEEWTELAIHVTVQNSSELTTTIRGVNYMSHLQGIDNENRATPAIYGCLGETTDSRMQNRIEFGPRARIEGTLIYSCFGGNDTFWIFGDVDNKVIFKVWEGGQLASKPVAP